MNISVLIEIDMWLYDLKLQRLRLDKNPQQYRNIFQTADYKLMSLFDIDMLNYPYDYSSIMHYPARQADSNPDSPVDIKPIPDETVSIGQLDGLSDLDVKK